MRFAKPLLAVGIVLEIAAAALGGYAIRLGTTHSDALAWLVLAMVAAVAGMAAIIGGMYMLIRIARRSTEPQPSDSVRCYCLISSRRGTGRCSDEPRPSALDEVAGGRGDVRDLRLSG